VGFQHEQAARDDVFWERRLPACSIRQLAECTGGPSRREYQPMFAASCRQLQASSLCSPTMSAMIIRNGRVVDPANRRDEIADLYVADGKVVGSLRQV
jgi:hypothetical protein